MEPRISPACSGEKFGNGREPLSRHACTLASAACAFALVRAAVATKIQRLRGKRERRAALLDDVHDPQQDVLPDAEEFRPVAGRHVREHLDVERGGTETDEPRARRVGVNTGMAQEHFPELDEEVAQLLRARLVAHSR